MLEGPGGDGAVTFHFWAPVASASPTKPSGVSVTTTSPPIQRAGPSVQAAEAVHRTAPVVASAAATPPGLQDRTASTPPPTWPPTAPSGAGALHRCSPVATSSAMATGPPGAAGAVVAGPPPAVVVDAGAVVAVVAGGAVVVPAAVVTAAFSPEPLHAASVATVASATATSLTLEGPPMAPIMPD